MKHFKPADEILAQGHRSVVLLGAPKTGKTMLVCSGSKNAGDNVSPPDGRVIDTPDVLLFQRDTDGHLGVLDFYRPLVSDGGGDGGWLEVNRRFGPAFSEALEAVKDKQVNVVGIDLSSFATDIINHVSGAVVLQKDKFVSEQQPEMSMQKWQAVAAIGNEIFRRMRTLPCLVVVQCHVKSAMGVEIGTDAQKANAALVRDARSLAGEASKLASDVTNGLMKPWLANSSFIFARSCETDAKGVRNYMTLTAPDGIHQIGSRRQSVLPTRTDASLRKLMELAYTVNKPTGNLKAV